MRSDKATPPPTELEDLVWVVTVLESDARLKKNIKVS
jgi:hypothetical protein